MSIVADESGLLVWLYIPIIFMLLTNVIGCILIVWKIASNDNMMAKMKLNINGTKRDPLMARYASMYRARLKGSGQVW